MRGWVNSVVIFRFFSLRPEFKNKNKCQKVNAKFTSTKPKKNSNSKWSFKEKKSENLDFYTVSNFKDKYGEVERWEKILMKSNSKVFHICKLGI